MKYIYFIALTTLSLFTASTALSEEDDAVRFSFTTALWSQYHGSNGAIFDDSPSLQSVLTVSSSGWYGGVWVARDFDGEADFGDEEDLFVGKTGEMFGYTYDVGAQIFRIHRPTVGSGDVLNVYMQISQMYQLGQDWIASPFLKIDRYQPIDAVEPVAGEGIKLGSSFTRQFDEWTVGITPHILHDTGAFGFSSNDIGFLNLSVNRSINQLWSVGVLGRVSSPLGHDEQRGSEYSLAIQLSSSW